ncbi:ribbon-helix-helix domain-containing protein [Actinomadura sp. 6N118]|uniref:ribbon-helix-helix domain-containing protein n=1 Tax=Actinomadura sp. 6N118 TaxID=3375151 RepID=UPI0037B8AF93
MRRLNITLPDDLADTLQALVEDKKIASVSGFLAEGARLKLAYLQDAATVDELFGPPSPEEQALVEHMTEGGTRRDRAMA